jgi:hypothetical protein
MSTQIKLKNVRFSYAHLWKPRVVKGSTNGPSFSVALIIPKDHPQVAEIKEAIRTEIADRWPDPKKRPPKLHNPLRDGDAEKEGDEVYANAYFINARSGVDYPPMVYDGQRNKVENSSFWGSGDYGNAAFDLYPFDVGTNRGIGVGLKQVQFVRKGEPLGFSNAAPLFDVEEGGEESMYD